MLYALYRSGEGIVCTTSKISERKSLFPPLEGVPPKK